MMSNGNYTLFSILISENIGNKNHIKNEIEKGNEILEHYDHFEIFKNISEGKCH